MLKNLPGKLIERVPISKDCMVLAYLKEWSHGEVDNIAVANNDGGVRTLLAWKPLPAKTTEGPNRRVYLAVYWRKTHGREGRIGDCRFAHQQKMAGDHIVGNAAKRSIRPLKR